MLDTYKTQIFYRVPEHQMNRPLTILLCTTNILYNTLHKVVCSTRQSQAISESHGEPRLMSIDTLVYDQNRLFVLCRQTHIYVCVNLSYGAIHSVKPMAAGRSCLGRSTRLSSYLHRRAIMLACHELIKRVNQLHGLGIRTPPVGLSCCSCGSTLLLACILCMLPGFGWPCRHSFRLLPVTKWSWSLILSSSSRW